MHLTAQQRAEFVGAFANLNSGDISPNLNLSPGSGPTDDEFENTREIGTRQADAVRSQLASSGDPVGSGVASRITYVDMRGYQVRDRKSVV